MKNNLICTIKTAFIMLVLTIATWIPAYAQTEGYGPGFVNQTPDTTAINDKPDVNVLRGESLGMFTTTGYCNCAKCSGGHNLTYAGTVPEAEHTISADLDLFPLGTKLIIGDIIYTVEDKGSAVTGNKLDVYYASHDEAWGHGLKSEEVFAVIDLVPEKKN